MKFLPGGISIHTFYCDNGEIKAKRISSSNVVWIETYTLFCKRCARDPENIVAHAGVIISYSFCINARYLFSEDYIYNFVKKNDPESSESHLQKVTELIGNWFAKTPSIQKFKKEAAVLCNKLKSGEITYDEAEYYFDKGMDRFERKVEKEYWRVIRNEIINSIKDPVVSFIKIIIAIIAAIGTVVGILVGIKKLSNKNV